MKTRIKYEDDLSDDLLDSVAKQDVALAFGAKHGRGREGEDTYPISTKKARHSSGSVPNDEASCELKLLAQNILVEKFGFDSFRHEQEASINRILNGQNALVVFPTGGGKSLCYQIPAIAFEEIDRRDNQRTPGLSGVTIVVSPLLALMKDQVDTLRKKGIAAECMDSTKTWEDRQKIHHSLREGQLRLLYCAPERLNNESFLASMKHVKGGVRLVAVDEAHCISEWGHTFRPDYLKVARFVQEIEAERTICLTATATPVVIDDICKAFNISKEGVFKTSPYRPNLRLEAKPVKAKAEKYKLLSKFLQLHPGSTLVYVTRQKDAEETAIKLKEMGFSADFFHAGMKLDDKKSVQEGFMESRVRIVVATIAFGMGIDKPDIRNVVHWDLPSSVEEYCQHIGRAGRDGEPSQCMLYLCPQDFYIKESFARGDLPSRGSLRSLLTDIFNDQNVQLSPGDTLEAIHYAQASEFDIRPTSLGNVYAALELRFNFFRAITPEYSSYTFTATSAYFPYLKNKNSPEAKAILANAKKARTRHSIDPSSAAQLTGLRRNDLVQLLTELDNTGAIKLEGSGVKQRYRVLKKLPQTADEIDTLTDKLYTDLKRREKQALERVQQVIGFITASKCFACSIAEYLGMSLPDGMDQCGHCTFCLGGKPVKLPPSVPEAVDQGAIQRVLAATDVRDDARFLTRVAFGISSPRVRTLKLHKDDVFMSMADQDFDMVLKEFQKVCGEEED